MPETKDECRRSCCRKTPPTRVFLGIGCIVLALLILLLCAPAWFVALLFSALLVVLGLWLIFRPC